MRATESNTTGTCERCGQRKSYVMGSAFQGDGTATFRMLCTPCDRIERPRHQGYLFVNVRTWEPVPEPEIEEEPEEDLLYSPQMDLFAPGELRR